MVGPFSANRNEQLGSSGDGLKWITSLLQLLKTFFSTVTKDREIHVNIYKNPRTLHAFFSLF